MSETKIIKSSCDMCIRRCQVNAYVKDGKLVSVEGIGGGTEKKGGLCAKGVAAAQYVYNKERILYPMKRVGEKGEGRFQRISWEEAYTIIAENLLRIREKYGAKAAVFYTGFPKWMRPAMLRLANAYGTPNYFTQSSTCFKAVDFAWRLMYGTSLCPPDLKRTECVLVWGCNLYHSNTPMSRTYQGLQKKKVKIIAIDPVHTVTAHEADIHLQLFPGTDGALALSMAYVIINEGLYDREFVQKYVYGFEEYCDYVQEFSPEKAEKITGVPAEKICRAARTYALSPSASIMYSASSIVLQINGVQNQRAIFSLCALTGNFDVKGGNRTRAEKFSPANEFKKLCRTSKEEAIGQKEYPIWFELCDDEAQGAKIADYILHENPYPIKAVFGMGLNHRMWAQPKRMLKALEKLHFYVNVDLFMSESSIMADVVLPACTSYEREEIIVLKSGRFYLSNHAIEPLGESKHDIEIIIELLKRMNLKDEVLEKGYEAYMQHIIEPSGLSLEGLRGWPKGMEGKNIIQPQERIFENDRIHTLSGKIELKSLLLGKYKDYGYCGLPKYSDIRSNTVIDRQKYPFVLVTGDSRPQMFNARLYRMSWLSNIEKRPLVEIHPEDARKLGICEGQSVLVSSPKGEMKGIASYNVSILQGVIRIYHGDAKGDVNELMDPEYVDPISGFPGFKGYFVAIRREI